MSRFSRVLESIDCEITQGYRKNEHDGIDIVKKDYKLDNIVAHSSGKIVQVVKDCLINTNGKDGNILDKNNPGNMVKIDHGNGYYTRYLHLEYGSIVVKVVNILLNKVILTLSLTTLVNSSSSNLISSTSFFFFPILAINFLL